MGAVRNIQNVPILDWEALDREKAGGVGKIDPEHCGHHAFGCGRDRLVRPRERRFRFEAKNEHAACIGARVDQAARAGEGLRERDSWVSKLTSSFLPVAPKAVKL